MQFQWKTSLRRKTLVIVLAALVVLEGGLYAFSRIVLLGGFSRLEEDFASQNLGRASLALSNEVEGLQHLTLEYANRDQTYAYTEAGNSKGLANEFSNRTFEQLRANFIVVIDRSGHPVFAQGYDLAALTPRTLSPAMLTQLKSDPALRGGGGAPRDVKGILTIQSKPVLLASSPILSSDANGTPAGRLILGRSLDSDETVRLSEITDTLIDIGPLDLKLLPKDFAAATQKISDSQPIAVHPYPGSMLAAYEDLHDINGRRAAVLRVLLSRTIYQQGQTTLIQFLLLLLASGFLFGAIVLYLLERFVTSRVASLSRNISKIGVSGNLTDRVEVSGHDELAKLSASINEMLEDLDRVQTERQEERTRLAMMVERMPAVLWTADTNLRIKSATGAGLAALEIGSPIGLSVFEFFATDDPGAPPIAAHRRALAGEIIPYETAWKERQFESHVQPLRDAEGKIQGVIGVALDITEREKLTDQLRQSQKMQAVGELAGGVAHDFNNLLMVVKGHAQLLLDRMPDGSQSKQSVTQIEKAADRAAALTRQLLAFSRKQVLQPRVLDMNEVVAGMIRMFSRVIGANIDMAFLPGGNLSRVKADPGQIEQVLLNLVVNARDAMPDGGRLTIETSNVELDQGYAALHASVEPGHYVMLTVTDTGCGMDEKTQARIFEPFFTTKAPGKGTGLGLATVYGVVKQSGGYIYVYSELNRGTTFKIYLPKVVAEVDKVVATPEGEGHARGSETILFVEDEQSVRDLVREYLGPAGYCVLEAADGLQALRAASAHPGPIHLLITDVVMPHLSGPELATKISATRPDMKVLFISGYTDDTVFRHGVLEGDVAFLQKPFNLKALAKKIREVLSGRTVSVESHPELEEA